MTYAFFGRSWHRDFLLAGTEVATPVGQPCMWCEEPFQDGDSGTLLCAVDAQGAAALRPIHRECQTRMMQGSVAHLTSQCSCHGHKEQDYPGSRRQEALAVQAIVDSERITFVGVVAAQARMEALRNRRRTTD